MGNGGWGYEDVLPFFRKLEDFEDGDPRYRGRGGPISVERLRLNLPVTRAFIDACAEAGIPENGDYNGASIEGASPLQFNTRYGRRQSAAVRSEEHTSELQSLMRISYAVFCLKKKNTTRTKTRHK